MHSYFKRRQFSKSQVLASMEKGLWPDGSSARICCVWPDEGIFIAYYSMIFTPATMGLSDLIGEYGASFYGPPPDPIPNSEIRSSTFEFETVKRGSLYCEEHAKCMLLPRGCIVLQERVELNGELVREYVVSKDADNPQPRLDFSEVIELRLPQPIPIAA